MILCSFIIPLYNGECFIEECVNQILKNPNQELYEIIIINDGSTDNSESICLKLKKIYNNIIYYKTSNRGVSETRNYGIHLATGKYIAFVDQDDLISDNMLTDIKSISKKGPDIILFEWSRITKRYIPHEKNKKSEFILKEYSNQDRTLLIKNMLFPIDKELEKASLVFPWGKAYRKSFLIENNIQFNHEVKICEDVYFNIKCYMKSQSVIYINKIDYYYFDNRKSAGSSYNPEASFIGIVSNNLITDLLSEVNDKEIFIANTYSVLYRYWWCVIVDFYHVENKDSIIQRANRMKELKENLCYKEAFSNVTKAMFCTMDFNQKLIMQLISKDHFILASLICKIRIIVKNWMSESKV